MCSPPSYSSGIMFVPRSRRASRTPPQRHPNPPQRHPLQARRFWRIARRVPLRAVSLGVALLSSGRPPPREKTQHQSIKNKTQQKEENNKVKFVMLLCRVRGFVSVASPLSPLRSRPRAHSRPADCAVRGYRGRAPSVGLPFRASTSAPPPRLCAGKMAQSAWCVAPVFGVSGERVATTACSVCPCQYARRAFPAWALLLRSGILAPYIAHTLR